MFWHVLLSRKTHAQPAWTYLLSALTGCLTPEGLPMFAYLFSLLAISGRIAPHLGGFTAIGGSLLYFGARRPIREWLAPLAALMLTDWYLTSQIYNYSFSYSGYIPTWIWYVAALALGRILLRDATSIFRVVSASLLSSTTFFLFSNFASWRVLSQPPTVLYPATPAGLGQALIAGLPFYRNDLLSTLLVSGMVFGLAEAGRRRTEALSSKSGSRSAA